ncbi:VOC family protein [Roseiarcaceae bacterium H3SJ34-1]|uniref:VOC family protein n=1 Tax=Terripilifer ovatus TaxID=3032367 RepID=UPI003AB971EF|nr:VOC family protein [Roseiarcaceae bacterium H3SJ34-1]
MQSNVPAINRLHHFAWRCRDAEETRQFYEDVLGLPLVHVIEADTVPSTGEHSPYVHLFFRMADGSNIAFFDLGNGESPAPSPNTPGWVIHFAMEVNSETDLLTARQRLEQHGVSVIGVTDHGFVRSIYFFDPNGLRLELTVRTSTDREDAAYAREAHEALSRWTARAKAKVAV